MSHPSVDKFGQFVIVAARDATFEFFDKAVKQHWKGPFQSRQAELATLDPATVEIMRRWVREGVDHALAEVLQMVVEASDFHGLKLLVDEHNVAELSDGLSAEPYSEYGWFARYSQFGDPEVKSGPKPPQVKKQQAEARKGKRVNTVKKKSPKQLRVEGRVKVPKKTSR